MGEIPHNDAEKEKDGFTKVEEIISLLRVCALQKGVLKSLDDIPTVGQIFAMSNCLMEDIDQKKIVKFLQLVPTFQEWMKKLTKNANKTKIDPRYVATAQEILGEAAKRARSWFATIKWKRENEEQRLKNTDTSATQEKNTPPSDCRELFVGCMATMIDMAKAVADSMHAPAEEEYEEFERQARTQILPRLSAAMGRSRNKARQLWLFIEEEASELKEGEEEAMLIMKTLKNFLMSLIIKWGDRDNSDFILSLHKEADEYVRSRRKNVQETGFSIRGMVYKCLSVLGLRKGT